MRKIREFNLRLPFKELRLRANRALDLEAMGIDDQALSDLIKALEERARSAVVFETYGSDNEDKVGLAPIPGLGRTVGLVSLGPDVAPWVEEHATESEEGGKLAKLLADHALDRCVKFILNLIKDDVEEERCELSPIHPIEDAEHLAHVLETLEGAKIDIGLDAGHLTPSYSMAFCVSWIARKGRPTKKKKSRAGSRRR